jgi:uncharacterized protein
MESVVIQAEDRQLAGSLFRPDTSASASPSGKFPGLLFVHGFRSDQGGYQERARVAAHELGAVCLTFDLSGHGAHGSATDLRSLTPRDHIVDVTAAYDALTSSPLVDGRRIGVCAASYGAYLACLVTRHRPVAQLLLRAPAMYGDDEYDVSLGIPRRIRAESSASMLTGSLRAFSGDVLVLESGADEVIPHGVIDVYLRACPKARHVTIPDASHALTRPEWRERFVQEILAFFREL